MTDEKIEGAAKLGGGILFIATGVMSTIGSTVFFHSLFNTQNTYGFVASSLLMGGVGLMGFLYTGGVQEAINATVKEELQIAKQVHDEEVKHLRNRIAKLEQVKRK